MNETEFENCLLQEAAAFSGAVKERRDGTLYAREWRVRFPNGGDTTIYWDASEGRGRAAYAVKPHRLAKTLVHNVAVDTPEQLRAFLGKIAKGRPA